VGIAHRWRVLVGIVHPPLLKILWLRHASYQISFMIPIVAKSM
jgi:hypothetical protein